MNFGGKLFLIISYIFLSNFIFNFELKSETQNIQWASYVIGFSSQNNALQYSANQILGEPNVMPDFGISPCSWTHTMNSVNLEWIQVQFNEPIYVEQIAVVENYNPGAITSIILFDSLSRGYQVFSNNSPKLISDKGRVLNVFIDKTPYRVFQLKIELIPHKYEPYQINAVAISNQKTPIEVKINKVEDTLETKAVNLGPNINSKYSELAPIISPDGKTLYYTRNQHPDNTGQNKAQDIWFSKKDENGNFLPAQNLGPPINNENTNFLISISPDGNTMYLGNRYYTNGRMGVGISKSHFDGEKWSFPEPIEIEEYYNLSKATSFCFASNGKVLISSLERKEGLGGMDLYVSFLKENGIWSKPKSLGKNINTADNEITPYLATDNETLYFSSGGFPGYGANDMFVTRRLDDTWENWSEPLNLGPSINTPGWDAYYTITASGDFAYFVSTDNSMGENDIFRIELPQEAKPKNVVIISGKVLSKDTEKALEAEIIYEILPEGEEAGKARSNPLTGEYQIVLPVGYNYGFLASAENYIAINENINLSDSDEYKEIIKDLYLVPLRKGETIRLNNIFFEYGEYVLLQESFPELQRIAKILKDKPSINIQINGHTDNVGSAAFNLELSAKRAMAVADYLISLGIERKRVKTKGYGFTVPIATNETEEGRQLNRRVEFEILEN